MEIFSPKLNILINIFVAYDDTCIDRYIYLSPLATSRIAKRV